MKQKKQNLKQKSQLSKGTFKALRAVALKARDFAHAPYSKFHVGAAVLTESGEIFGGCNVENASYGATICAERSAVVAAISNGNKKIEAVYLVTTSDEPWPPCGMCRQVLLEFAAGETPVISMNKKGKTKSFTLGQLCPEAFTPDQL